MENANNLAPIAMLAEIDDVRSAHMLEIAWTNIDDLPTFLAQGELLERGNKIGQVAVRLFNRPGLERVAPDVFEIDFSKRCKPVASARHASPLWISCMRARNASR